jgi:hypothetical protein
VQEPEQAEEKEVSEEVYQGIAAIRPTAVPYDHCKSSLPFSATSLVAILGYLVAQIWIVEPFNTLILLS